MKNKILLFIFSLALTISLGSFERVSACWCRSITSCEATNKASSVFVGKVLKIIPDENVDSDVRSYKTTILFQVKETFPGKNNKTIEIRTGSDFGPGDCNYFSFKKDEIYIVYAYEDEETGKLRVSECGGTKLLAKANDDLKYLRNTSGENHNGKILGSVFGYNFDPQLKRYDDATLAGIPLLLTGNGINKTILTNDFGDYEISGLKAGKYNLQVYLPEIYELLSNGRDDSVREIDLNGKGCAKESFFPEIKNILEGTVKDNEGKPMKNIEVSLIPEIKKDENDTDNNYTEFTGDNGKFMFRNIFPRRYVLGINIEDDEDTPKVYYPNTLTAIDAVKIDFGLGKKLSGYDLIWNRYK